MKSQVVSVSRCPKKHLKKSLVDCITLSEEKGVKDDISASLTTDHAVGGNERFSRRIKGSPIRLITEELLEELKHHEAELRPGVLGENIMIRGLDLSTLPNGTKLLIGMTAIVELTEFQHPLKHLEQVRKQLRDRTENLLALPSASPKTGLSGVILRGGRVYPGDKILVELPHKPWQPLIA